MSEQEVQKIAYAPVQGDMNRFVPQDQTGVDFLLVSPENDTSKRNLLDEKSGKVELTQTAHKNLNTVDVSTSNLSPSQMLSVSLLAIVSRECQTITDYYKTEEGRKEKIRYDLSEAQSVLTDVFHTLCTISKAGKPVGGFLLSAIRTRIEHSESSMTEKVLDAEKEEKEKKKGFFKSWK